MLWSGCQEVRVNEASPQVSAVHDGHDQTQLCFRLEGVRQRDNEPAVNSSEDPLLHHCPLRDRKGQQI